VPSETILLKYGLSLLVLQEWGKTGYRSWKSDKLLLSQEDSAECSEREGICSK